MSWVSDPQGLNRIFLQNQFQFPRGENDLHKADAASDAGGNLREIAGSSSSPHTVTETVSDTATPRIADTNPTDTGATTSTAERVVDIGEDMEGRVKPFESQYGYETMRPLSSDFCLSH